MIDVIVTHEDWQQVDARNFMSHYYFAAKGKPLPDTKLAKGEVLAYVNWGRWIAECPDCHDARIASQTFPYFICLNCDFNDGEFANVVFPAEKAEIETELLKRTAVHPYKMAPTRNWNQGETVQKLQDENVEHPELLKLEFRGELTPEAR